jgi:hypothetical protein
MPVICVTSSAARVSIWSSGLKRVTTGRAARSRMKLRI